MCCGRECITFNDSALVVFCFPQVTSDRGHSVLCEGCILSIEEVTGVRRDTVMRLGVKIGHGCAALMHVNMRNLDCTRLEMDEVWGYVGKKRKYVRPSDEPQFGNVCD